jgi:MFS family permease
MSSIDHAEHPRHVLDHHAHARHAWDGLGDAFEALSERRYLVYFLGQCVSASGPWMQAAAVAWLVLELTGSPMAMGTVASLQFLPIVPLSLVGGLLADRVSKLDLMLVCKVFETVQAVVFGVLVLSGTIRLWELYVLALSLGVSVALSQPAMRAFTSELLPADKLASGLALTTTVMTTARFLGPALAGVTLATVGAGVCFLLNAASYVGLLGALLALRAGHRYAPPPRPAKASAGGGIVEMLRFVWSSPNVLFELVLTALLGAFGYNFSTALLPLIARHEHVTSARGLFEFGLAMVLGSLVGMAVSGRAKTASRALSVVATAAFALLLIAVSLTTSFRVTLILLAAIGAALMVFGVSANTTVQLLTPPQLTGRVMSLYMICYLGTPTIGGLVTGALAEAWGVRAALMSEGALVAAGLLLAMLYLHRRLHAPPQRGLATS